MGFWLFMLLMVLLCPLTMIGYGRKFLNNMPQRINSSFGYRTRMSSINRETWEFAHKYCGKIWYITGLILLSPSVVVMLLVFGKNNDVVGTMGGITEGIQICLILASILSTELALRKHFDKNGNRKDV